MNNTSNTPEEKPLGGQNLARASVFGVGLSVIAIVVFIVLWVVLGNLGMDQLPRLLLSLCLPPLIIALVVGGYALMRRSR